MKSLVQRLENRVTKLEGGSSTSSAQAPTPAKAAPAPAEDDDDDDDIDLFGSDEVGSSWAVVRLVQLGQ
jgi:hypothetical protein